MKRIPSCLFAICSLYALTSCHSSDSLAPTLAITKATLLFWTNDRTKLNCGAITVSLSTGQQANITGYYPAAPTSCVNQVGGYFYLDEGTYTYKVITGSGCAISGGTVIVIGNQCNMTRLQ